MTPVALFLYGRPDHTIRTVEALLANTRAADATLIVFCDGPRSPAAAERVAETRRAAHALLDRQDRFAAVEFVERDENRGLSRSIVEGIDAVVERFGRAVVVEDDLVTSPHFLAYMIAALDRYENEPAVFTISGYAPGAATVPIPADYECDAYFNPRNSAWGWGIWRDRWRKIDFAVEDYAAFKDSLSGQLAFNRGGDDMAQMLYHQMERGLGTWDIQMSYSLFRHHGVSLCPRFSFVDNIGLDGSGEHCGAADHLKVDLSLALAAPRFPDRIAVDERIMDGFRAQFARPRPGLIGGGARAYWDAQRGPADVKRLLTAANWLDHGGLDKAKSLLELHLDMIPGDPDALVLLGRVALAVEQPQAARSLFVSALSTFGDHPAAWEGLREAAEAAARSAETPQKAGTP